MGDTYVTTTEMRACSIIVLVGGAISEILTIIMFVMYGFKSGIHSLENSIYILAVIFIAISTGIKMASAAMIIQRSMTENMCLVLGGGSILTFSAGTVMSTLFFILLIAKIHHRTPFSSFDGATRITLILCVAISLVYSTLTTVMGSIRWNGRPTGPVYGPVYGFCGSPSTHYVLIVPAIAVPTMALTISSLVAYGFLLARSRGVACCRYGSVHVRYLGLQVVLLTSFFIGLLTNEQNDAMAAIISSYAAILAILFMASERIGPFACARGRELHEIEGFTPSLKRCLAFEFVGEAAVREDNPLMSPNS